MVEEITVLFDFGFGVGGVFFFLPVLAVQFTLKSLLDWEVFCLLSLQGFLKEGKKGCNCKVD